MSIYVAPRPAAPVLKAGPIGPGAGPLMTEFLLPSVLPFEPQRKMVKAWQLGIACPWVREAESVIGGKLAGADWSLEDDQEQTIDDDYADARAVEAYDLMDKPQAHAQVGTKLSRRNLLKLTSRHMGLCGNAFWYLDQQDQLAGIPLAILYIRPDRLTPAEDEAGNLIGWWLDRSHTSTGTKIGLDQIIHFKLDEPDQGHFGIGLVESAFVKISMSQATDQHALEVMSSAGRLSGIMAPKAGGVISDDTQYEQLIRDWRNIAEQPNAAKRLQVVRAPVDFTSTVMTMDELKVIDFMNGSRDYILQIWGVPLSQVGGTTPAGLNGGDTKKYDEASLWQGPVHDRITEIEEKTQDGILDRFEALLGYAPEYEIDEPTFDDDSPRYDLLGKSLNIAMTNAERRDLIGLPPIGDPAIDNQIVLPVTTVAYATAPLGPNDTTSTAEALGRSSGQDTTEAATAVAPPTPGASQAAAAAAGETATSTPGGQRTSSAKADLPPNRARFHNSLVALRKRIDATMTPTVQRAVKTLLTEQRDDVVSKVRRNWEHIRTKHDRSGIFPVEKWNKRLLQVMQGSLAGVAETVNAHINLTLGSAPQKADPLTTTHHVLTRGATRVTGITATTAAAIEEAIQYALDNDMTADEAATYLEGLGIFDDYRAELIARTEMMAAYNAAALATYTDAGIEYVQAIDGTGDPECAERDGQVMTADEADMIEDHPNGTLDWIPYLEEPMALSVEGKAQAFLEAVKADGLAKDERMTRAVESFASVVNGMSDAFRASQSRPIDLHAHVDAPIVNVTAPEPVVVPAPIVNLPEPRAITRTVERDAEGRITKVVES